MALIIFYTFELLFTIIDVIWLLIYVELYLEFGFPSFPCMKTVETFTLPEERNIFSHVMESHQKNGSANGKTLYYLSENFKYPKDF